MVVVNILHMSSGVGKTSYANNSFLQETVMKKVLPVLKHTIKGIANHDGMFSNCFKVADLGCSSSKNTLVVASNIVETVTQVYKENYRKPKPPQFQIYLNDLFGNDFNSLFKMLPDFYAKLDKKGENFGRCFVSAVPGSFYGRLFPDQSLHLVHSSYSVHWLSQVPEGLESNAMNIYMTKRSPLNVLQAYRKQFYADFTKFLHMRSKEIVRGGCMILTFLSRSMSDPTSDDCCALWELLAQSLQDMLKEGLVQESDINSFNIPTYNPCEEEVRNAIESEGSFSVDSLKIFQVNWDPHDPDYTSKNDNEPNHIHGENTAKVVRAVTEPLLISHFGSSIVDGVFRKYGEHVAEHLAKKKTRHINIVISLTKK